MHLKKDMDGSRIIYVELTDQKKHTVRRIVLHSDNNEFAGQIELPDSLPPANYHLRAYTNWMRNAGEAYFYHRDIAVGSSSLKARISLQIQISRLISSPKEGLFLRGWKIKSLLKY